MGKIMYIWYDEQDRQRISSRKPEPRPSLWGCLVTPEYKKVVVIEVEDDD